MLSSQHLPAQNQQKNPTKTRCETYSKHIHQNDIID